MRLAKTMAIVLFVVLTVSLVGAAHMVVAVEEDAQEVKIPAPREPVSPDVRMLIKRVMILEGRVEDLEYRVMLLEIPVIEE